MGILDYVPAAAPRSLRFRDREAAYVGKTLSPEWMEWKKLNADKILHDQGYEERFVDDVLSRVPGLRPEQVKPQFEFKDREGKNRRIDFLIKDEEQGYHLPIELDGTYKDQSHDRWADFLRRQNSLIMQSNALLRYSNHEMKTDPQRIVQEISDCLSRQGLAKLDDFVREASRLERSRLVAEVDRLRKAVEAAQAKRALDESDVSFEADDARIAMEAYLSNLQNSDREGAARSKRSNGRLKLLVVGLLLAAVLTSAFFSQLAFFNPTGRKSASTPGLFERSSPSSTRPAAPFDMSPERGR